MVWKAPLEDGSLIISARHQLELVFSSASVTRVMKTLQTLEVIKYRLTRKKNFIYR